MGKYLTMTFLLISLTNKVNASRINIGVVPTSLGRTGIGGNQYVESFLGNPAGLHKIRGGNICISTSTNYIKKMLEMKGGGVTKFGSWAIGIAFNNQLGEKIELRQDIISLSKKFHPKLIIGLNLKDISVKINNSSLIPSLIEIDIGAEIEVTKDFYFGGVLYSRAISGKTDLYLPMEAGIGFLYKFYRISLSSDIIWVGKGNIPEYEDEHMIIGVGISSIERSFPLPHGWGIYVPIDYKENKIGWPHLTFNPFSLSNIFLISCDIE